LRRAIAPIVLMTAIFVLSAQPDLSTGLGIWDRIGRKFVHVGVWATLTGLWAWALRPRLARPLVPAVVVSVLYAVADEYHQSFVHGRDGSPVDVAIDVVGVLIAVALLRYDRRLRSALEMGMERS
jgi:VanZ family protein